MTAAGRRAARLAENRVGKVPGAPCARSSGKAPSTHSGGAEGRVAALLSAASGNRPEALYVAAVHTGLRRGELPGLKWTDVDLDAGALSVQRSFDKDGTFNPTRRKSSRRTVKLTGQAAEALKGHRARQNGERLRLGSLWEDRGLVFPNQVGKPMSADNLYHHGFKQLLQKAGLSGFTFHSSRHTCATPLMSKNVNPKIVSEMLGHATISQRWTPVPT